MPNDNTQKPTMSPTFNNDSNSDDSKLSREQAPAAPAARFSALDISPVELQQLNEFGSLIATDKFVVKTVELDDRKVQILEGMSPTPTDEVDVDFGLDMAPKSSAELLMEQAAKKHKLTPTPTPTPKYEPQIEADADGGDEYAADYGTNTNPVEPAEEAKNFGAAEHTSRAEDTPQRFISQDDFNGLTPRQQEQLRFLAAEMTASNAINAIHAPTPAPESKPVPKPEQRNQPAPSLRSAPSPKPNTAKNAARNAKRPSIFDTIRAKASVSMGAVKTAAPGIARDASAMGKKLGAAIEAAMQPWATSSNPGIPMSKQGRPGGLIPPNQSNLNIIRSDIADDHSDREDEIHVNGDGPNKPKIKPKRMTM
jgi:hypothetical protein